MIPYLCPKCETPMASPESMAGQTETCPDCGNTCRVPVAASAGAATGKEGQSAMPPPAGEPVSWPQNLTIDGSREKKTSGLGVAALVLGIVAVLGCWIPFLNVISIFLAAVGGLFALIGLLVAIVGRRSSVGMPISGLVVCVVAIVVAVVVTGGLSSAMIAASEETNQTQEMTLRTATDYVMRDVSEVAWMEVEGNNVYIGFTDRPSDLDMVIRGVALKGNEATGFGVHVWAVDAKDRGWRPGTGPYLAEVTARYGKIE